jgi:hypothetical protein
MVEVEEVRREVEEVGRGVEEVGGEVGATALSARAIPRAAETGGCTWVGVEIP